MNADELRRIAVRINAEADLSIFTDQAGRLQDIADDLLRLVDGERTGEWESDAT